MSNKRINIQTGLSWEPLRGYSRAVVVDNTAYISGTTAVNEKGEVIAPNDPYLQTKYVIHTIKEVLKKVNFSLSDVIKTRLFVTKISEWKAYANAHREFFETIRPTSSIVEVKRLIDPRLVVEMEAKAIKIQEKVETIIIPSFDIKLK